MSIAAPTGGPSTEKILARVRASLSLGLLGAESFQSLMDSNSGDVEELRRVASSLVTALNLIEDRASSLDMSDPNLIVPREIVTELAQQASTGEANISEWLASRRTAAKQAIQIGVDQSNALGAMTSRLEQLLASDDCMSVFRDSEEGNNFLTVNQSGSFPVNLCVTFTKQLAKKNKVFQDGRLVVESVTRVKLFDAFNQQVATTDLGRDPVKLLMFNSQFKQAVIHRQGYLHGVIDGVLVFLDSPPLLSGMIDDRVEFSDEHVSKRTRLFVPPQPVMCHVPALQPNLCPVVPLHPNMSVVFRPVSSLQELIALYPSDNASLAKPDSSGWLSAVNTIYADLLQRLNSSKSIIGEAKWTITKHSSPVVKYFISSSAVPKLLVNAIALIIKDQLLIFQPVWKGFNPNGVLQVRPVSIEAAEAAIGAVPVPILVAYGVSELQGSLDLVFALREMPATSEFCTTRLWLDEQRSCLRAIMESATESPNSVNNENDSGNCGKKFDDKLVFEISKKLSLNNEQILILQAVADWFEVPSKAPFVIAGHGVFGCGKSTLLAACVYLCAQATAHLPIAHARVLVMAATNVAVDNVLLKLRSLFGFEDFARVGVAERISDELTVSRKGNEWKTKRVVGATAATSSDFEISCPFVFIDESAQLTQVAALLPLFNVRPVRLFLFGDTRQLVQTGTDEIPSVLAAFTARTKKIVHQFTQYRCHPEIAHLCSDLFYEGQVRTALVTKLARREIPGVPPVSLAMHHCKANKGSNRSLENYMEVELMLQFLKRPELVGKSIAIITFYVSQSNLVKEQLELRGGISNMPPVHTVDSFQGSEADVVLVSLTAHDPLRSRAFLGNPNRLNVALSRAKLAVVLFGNKRLFEGIEVLREIAARFPNNILDI